MRTRMGDRVKVTRTGAFVLVTVHDAQTDSESIAVLEADEARAIAARLVVLAEAAEECRLAAPRARSSSSRKAV